MRPWICALVLKCNPRQWRSQQKRLQTSLRHNPRVLLLTPVSFPPLGCGGSFKNIWVAVRRSCPETWCNNGEAIVITGGAGSIKLPPRRAV